MCFVCSSCYCSSCFSSVSPHFQSGVLMFRLVFLSFFNANLGGSFMFCIIFLTLSTWFWNTILEFLLDFESMSLWCAFIVCMNITLLSILFILSFHWISTSKICFYSFLCEFSFSKLLERGLIQVTLTISEFDFSSMILKTYDGLLPEISCYHYIFKIF